METPLVIGGFALVLVSTGTLVVARVLRQSRLPERKRREAFEKLQEQGARVAVEEETCIAAVREVQIKARAESSFRVEEAAAAVVREPQCEIHEETRLQPEGPARILEAHEAQRVAGESAPQYAKEESRLVAKQEVLHEATDESHCQTDEEAASTTRGMLDAGSTNQLPTCTEDEARVADEQAPPNTSDDRVRLRDKVRVDNARGDAHGGAPEVADANDVHASAMGSEVTESSAATMEHTPSHAALPIEAAPVVALVSRPAPALPAPRQYRPSARVPAVRRDTSAVISGREARERAIPIEVRLVFEKAGFCRLSLLPRRPDGMPAELPVTGSGNPPELLALEDSWYQDVVPSDLGRLLRDGIVWSGALPEHNRFRASLSGREIFVLAHHNEISGFVSAPRLVLGAEHVVLCVTERLAEVRTAIALTGSSDPVLLSADSGIPGGWTGLRGITPRNPIAPSATGEILDALRPLAGVEIAMVGGIRIDRQTWLAGFPPSVRLHGDTSTIAAVTIDGSAAEVTPEGTYFVHGWDAPGEHSVWCTSDSRTYSIRGGAEEWRLWDAYTWSLGELTAESTLSRPGICGVLVRPPRLRRSDSRATVVPASNPVLIGAAPGEIEICSPRQDVRAGLCIGFPWFEPIWAIPADVFRCDKRTARVLLLGRPQPVAAENHRPNKRPAERRSRAGYTWCESILTAGRKRLQTEPSRVEVSNLWKTYIRCAKTLRRSWR